MSTFSSANITDGNLLLKERTHRIKIKYSVHQYSIRLHNLGNGLIAEKFSRSKVKGQGHHQTNQPVMAEAYILWHGLEAHVLTCLLRCLVARTTLSI